VSYKKGQVYTPEGRAYKRKGKYWFVHWTADADWTDSNTPPTEISAEDWDDLMREYGPPQPGQGENP